MNTMRRIGFRKIPNDIYHTLQKSRLSGGGVVLVMAVMDMTIGYHKEWANISLAHFKRLTDLSKQSVCNSIKEAEARHIIFCHRESTRKTAYSLNYYTEEWLPKYPIS